MLRTAVSILALGAALVPVDPVAAQTTGKVVAAAGAAQMCPGGVFQPDPPIFRFQDRIFDFDDLDATLSHKVEDFQSIPDFAGFDADDPPVIPPGDPVARYLNPSHPRFQPNTPLPEWRRVRCAPTPIYFDEKGEAKCKASVEADKKNYADDSAEKAAALRTCGKKHREKLPRQWVRRDGQNDDARRAFAGKFLNTLPKITPPEKIRVSYVRTGPSLFPGKVDLDGDGEVEETETVDPFANPPGTNMLPTVHANLRDSGNVEITNTLPSTKERPYALHDGKPVVTLINPLSPSDDLRYILETLAEVVLGTPYRALLTDPDNLTLDALKAAADGAEERLRDQSRLVERQARWALNMIEGNDGALSGIPEDRAYRGFGLLNHSGHTRVNRVMPVYDATGAVVGGEAVVRQLWYGGRIQSDTMFFDFGWERKGPTVDYVNCGGPGQPSAEDCAAAAPIPPELPWTIRYEINVLARGNDDFSPMTMHFDCPWRLAVGGTVIVGHGPDENVTCSSAADETKVKRQESQLAYVDRENGSGEVDVFTEWPGVEWKSGPLQAAFDQSFFPMEDGTRVSLGIRMAPPQYYNLTYTWGWRKHPPRAQAIENAHKVVPPPLPFADRMAKKEDMEDMPDMPPALNMGCHPLAAGIVEHERWAFEGFPQGNDAPPGLVAPDSAIANTCLKALRAMVAKHGVKPEEVTRGDAGAVRRNLLKQLYPATQYPIDKIGDLAPAKRMWRAFCTMRKAARAGTPQETPQQTSVGTRCEEFQPPQKTDGEEWLALLLDARDAYLDWLHRTRLPSGVAADPESDMTLLFVNNTIYGQITAGGYLEMPNWRRRGDLVRVTLINGDYFPHGYLNVDFGGARGWENTFKSTVQTAGSGPWFTFGRYHARFNTVPGSIVVDPATPSDNTHSEHKGDGPTTVTPGMHRVMLKMNFEPSPRLRMYQFDPLHHDVAIYSVH